MKRSGAGIPETPIPRPDEVGAVSAIAIDFETASTSRASACAVGLAWVANDRVVHTAHRLIRPPELRFDPFAISIHGIRPEMVVDKPEFPEIWREIAPHLGGALLLAHNAAFDMSVLRAILEVYGLPRPTVRSLCTVKVARHVWPALPHHRLPDVAGHLGIRLHHHNAASDAGACAEIALSAARARALPGVTALPEHLGIVPGWL
ncbi:3'-5' exonuclease [Pararhodospirillum photometricum]|uniref:3'-5' exonuclease n=1 Tax=Pararhodospirillum photometricum DSM 122 TaxID=1150469 RepID=H6SP97_PARPM|nr:3'-5' exonuclease [Pararhodospirillum photometricum]CCG09422.1 3'-5' exonuclease [Pararhodospirillum photometricum DSM 122]